MTPLGKSALYQRLSPFIAGLLANWSEDDGPGEADGWFGDAPFVAEWGPRRYVVPHGGWRWYRPLRFTFQPFGDERKVVIATELFQVWGEQGWQLHPAPYDRLTMPWGCCRPLTAWVKELERGCRPLAPPPTSGV